MVAAHSSDYDRQTVIEFWIRSLISNENNNPEVIHGGAR
jgi:hypothetical protein